MGDDIDRAQAREAELLSDALRDHARRAGLAGKTAADSAVLCGERSEDGEGCGELIPQARRSAIPGCRFCVACQARREHGKAAR